MTMWHSSGTPGTYSSVELELELELSTQASSGQADVRRWRVDVRWHAKM